MVQVSRIDAAGDYIEPVIVENASELAPDLIEVPVPNGYYKPHWTGSEWVEGKSEDEISAIKQAAAEAIVKAEANKVSSDPSALAIAELTAMVANLSDKIKELQGK